MVKLVRYTARADRAPEFARRKYGALNEKNNGQTDQKNTVSTAKVPRRTGKQCACPPYDDKGRPVFVVDRVLNVAGLHQRGWWRQLHNGYR